MTATKSQLIDFICETFVTPEGEHPTRAQLDVFKKDELAKVISDASVESQLESYIS